MINDNDSVWKIGNILRIETIYDYEERGEFSNHNTWTNYGKQIYEGVVEEYLDGKVLKCFEGLIFTTQGKCLG